MRVAHPAAVLEQTPLLVASHAAVLAVAKPASARQNCACCASVSNADVLLRSHAPMRCRSMALAAALGVVASSLRGLQLLMQVCSWTRYSALHLALCVTCIPIEPLKSLSEA